MPSLSGSQHSKAKLPPPPPVQVGILVNNAGLSYDHPEYLDEVEDEFVSDLVTINALVPAMVSLGCWARKSPSWACLLQLLHCKPPRCKPPNRLSRCRQTPTVRQTPSPLSAKPRAHCLPNPLPTMCQTPCPLSAKPHAHCAAVQAGAQGHAGAAARCDHQRGIRRVHSHPRLPAAVGCALMFGVITWARVEGMGIATSLLPLGDFPAATG